MSYSVVVACRDGSIHIVNGETSRLLINLECGPVCVVTDKNQAICASMNMEVFFVELETVYLQFVVMIDLTKQDQETLHFENEFAHFLDGTNRNHVTERELSCRWT